MPFSTLLDTPAGQSALQANLAGAIAINNGSSASARALAIHDNTIDTDRGTTLATGFGSKLQSLYFAAIYASNPLIGPSTSNIVQAFRQANGITQSDSGFAKNFFGSASTNGSPNFTPANGIGFPAGGQPNVYDAAYAPIPPAPGANLSGDSRPFQVRPGSIQTFSGNTFVAPAPGANPNPVGPVQNTTQIFAAGLNANSAFPSGHTTYGFTQSLMFAMMVPELYSQMLLRASEYGYSRVVLGVHYPLDVIGGRIIATYDMAQLLNNNPAYMNQQISVFAVGNVTTTSNFANLFSAAASDFRTLIASSCGMSVSACVSQSTPAYTYDTYQRDRATHAYRMTYGLPATGPANLAPIVPVGAEVLLATRFPYLTADQRREVLATTEVASGAALDNGTGWARLNLFDASGGYGAFRADTTVTMDAAAGGFSAADTWLNDIGGTGVLTKAGTGWLTLAGKNTFGGLNVVGGLVSLGNANTFSGTTNVGGGPIAAALSVDGSLSSAGGVNVLNGGYLAGNGTVGPNVSVRSGGTIAPGNSTGTLHVAGNIALAPGSTYQVETNATGAADRIAATGSAALGGSLQVLTAGTYTGSTQYQILTATGGVSGSFGSVSTGRVFVDPSVSYGGNAVTLTLTRLPFQSVAWSANEASAAAGVDSLGAGSPLWTAIDTQTSAQSARTAFDSLSGEIYASAQSVAIQRSGDVRDAIGNRLRQDGWGELGLTGLTPVDPVVVTTPGAAQALPTRPSPNLALWGQAYTAFGQLDSARGAAGTDQTTAGFILGADVGLGDNWRVGVAGGYSRSDIDVNGRLSSGALDNYSAAVYGSGRFGDVSLRLGAAYTWGDLSTNRAISFPGYGDATTASPRLSTAQAFGEAAYALRFGPVALEPYAGLAFVHVTGDGFAESGGFAALTGKSNDENVTFTTLGARVGGRWIVGDMALTARAGLGWRHAFGDITPDALLAFAGGSPFLVSGVPIARDAAVIEAGIGLDITRSVVLEVAYTGQLARQEQDQKIKASLKVNF